MNRPKVVILGGGFGGLAAARALYKDADVTVVDRHNYQTFLPLLYQVSTAGLAADHVAYPIRGALRKTSVKFRMASPINIDHRNKDGSACRGDSARVRRETPLAPPKSTQEFERIEDRRARRAAGSPRGRRS